MRAGQARLVSDGYLANTVSQLEFKLRTAQRAKLSAKLYTLLWMRIAGGMPDEFPTREYIMELCSRLTLTGAS